MVLDDDGMFARFEVLGDENPDINIVVSNLFERGAEDAEAVKAGFGCSVVVRRHVGLFVPECDYCKAKVARRS